MEHLFWYVTPYFDIKHLFWYLTSFFISNIVVWYLTSFFISNIVVWYRTPFLYQTPLFDIEHSFLYQTPFFISNTVVWYRTPFFISNTVVWYRTPFSISNAFVCCDRTPFFPQFSLPYFHFVYLFQVFALQSCCLGVSSLVPPHSLQILSFGPHYRVWLYWKFLSIWPPRNVYVVGQWILCYRLRNMMWADKQGVLGGLSVETKVSDVIQQNFNGPCTSK
jgi:hypothetical protein